MEHFHEIMQRHCDRMTSTRHGDQDWYTTMEVARCFGKEHGQVMSDIKKLRVSPEFRAENFLTARKKWKIRNSRQEIYVHCCLCSLLGVMVLALNYQGEGFYQMKTEIAMRYFQMSSELAIAKRVPDGDLLSELVSLQKQLAMKSFAMPGEVIEVD